MNSRAVTLQRPLLVKGEPGTGKTVLAHEIAAAPRHAAHRVAREKHHQGAAGASTNMTPSRACATASSATPACTTSATTSSAANSGRRSRPRSPSSCSSTKSTRPTSNFPTTCCSNSIACSSSSTKPRQTIAATAAGPSSVITSNNEKELPDAFLRRCFFHYIRFPDRETMERIVHAHYPGIKQELAREALTMFFRIARHAGPEKEACHQRASGLAEATDDRGHVRPEALRTRGQAKWSSRRCTARC